MASSEPVMLTSSSGVINHPGDFVNIYLMYIRLLFLLISYCLAYIWCTFDVIRELFGRMSSE